MSDAEGFDIKSMKSGRSKKSSRSIKSAKI